MTGREGSVLESRVSLSGYAPDDADDTAATAATATPAPASSNSNAMLARLTRFYAHYHPANLPRVAAVAQQYAGKETLLFALLVKKYGPEPPSDGATAAATTQRPQQGDVSVTAPPATTTTTTLLSSEAASVMHYSGRRVRFPTTVTPEQGNTDCATPYWAGGATLISERDLLALMLHGTTANSELQKCYMGTLAQHPHTAWNGMTYMVTTQPTGSSGTTASASDIAPPDTRFVGHVWAATLSSNKVLVYHGKQYMRTTLYCTEACQHDGAHERWRLSVYRDATAACTLLRTLWDPVVVPEPLPLMRSSGPLYDNGSSSSLSSSGEPLSASMASSGGGSMRSSEPQPLQPSLASTVAQLAARVTQLERAVCDRLDDLDARLARLERIAR